MISVGIVPHIWGFYYTSNNDGHRLHHYQQNSIWKYKKSQTNDQWGVCTFYITSQVYAFCLANMQEKEN